MRLCTIRRLFPEIVRRHVDGRLFLLTPRVYTISILTENIQNSTEFQSITTSQRSPRQIALAVNTPSAGLFRWLALTTFLALSACASQSDHIAAQNELEKQIITGTIFRHVVYRKKDDPSGKRLHIYVGSDGRPWIDGRTPAADPTPINPLALRLMVL